MDEQQMKNYDDVIKKWEQKSAGGSFASSDSSVGNGAALNEGREAWVKRFGGSLTPPNRRPPARSKRRPKNTHKDDFEAMPAVERKFQVPGAVIPAMFSKERPFMGRGCRTCCPDTEELFYSEDVPSKGMHNILNIAIYTKKNLFKRTFCHIDFILSRDVSHTFPDVKHSVLNSDRVKNCILNSVYQDNNSGSSPQKEMELDKLDKARQKQLSELNRKAKGIMTKMAAGIYRKLIRFTGWFLFKLFGRLLDSIQIHNGQIHMVQQAAEENKPLVFLPLHKSHLDYILVTYVLLTCNVKAPHVAAGDNLSHMLLFSWLMRHLGGFFIKRKLDHTTGKDDLYKSVLQEYIQQLLENGQNLEIFIEGSRSRTGKAMVPKSGLLSVVVNAVLEGVVPDVIIVPVNISYEKVFETSYSHELLGEPKRPETFFEAVKSIWEVFGARYGNIRIDFSRPFSLKEFSQSLDCSPVMQDFGSEKVARSSVTSTPAASMLRNYSDLSLSDFGEEQCFLLTKVLGYHVIYDAVQCSAVMSTNMLAFILLYIHRNGATLQQLMYAFDELRKQIVGRGRDVGFTGQTCDIVRHALNKLNDLIAVQQDGEQALFKPRLGIPHVIDLLQHSNLVLCIFAMESVLACSICAVAKERDIDIVDIEQDQTIPQSTIIDKAKDLCELLQKEFLFAPPCVSLETRLTETLEIFTASEILKSTNQSTSSNTRDWAHRFSVSTWDDEDEDTYDFSDQEYKLSTSKRELSRLKFLQSLLGPLIESYWVAACGLLWLPSQDFTESEFLKAVHDCAKERIADNVTMYPETCSLEPYRNAIRIFKETMVIELNTSENGQSFVRLSDKYNYEGGLFDFISHIGQFKM